MLKFSCLRLNSQDFEWLAKWAVRKGASKRGAEKGEFLHLSHSRLLSRDFSRLPQKESLHTGYIRNHALSCLDKG